MGKVPVDLSGRAMRDWTELRISEETAPAYFGGRTMNVGGLLGSPSRGLVDVDLDCPEAIAVAPRFLRPSASFGRASALRSHWLYRADPSGATIGIADPNRRRKSGGKAMLVELRT